MFYMYVYVLIFCLVNLTCPHSTKCQAARILSGSIIGPVKVWDYEVVPVYESDAMHTVTITIIIGPKACHNAFQYDASFYKITTIHAIHKAYVSEKKSQLRI